MSNQQDRSAELAGYLAVDIMQRGYHQPLVNGQANRDQIEDQITMAIYRDEIPYIMTQDIVDLAIESINSLIEKYASAGIGDRDSDR